MSVLKSNTFKTYVINEFVELTLLSFFHAFVVSKQCNDAQILYIMSFYHYVVQEESAPVPG